MWPFEPGVRPVDSRDQILSKLLDHCRDRSA